MIRKFNIILVALAVVLAAGTVRANIDLGQRIHHEIAMLPYSSIFDWVEADLQANGTVVLLGAVTRPSIKQDAEYRVRHLEGVTNLKNQIEILPLSRLDDQIRAGVYRSLFNRNSTLSGYALGANPSIHIIVDNGAVTLKGFVSSAMDKQLAGAAANAVFGVMKLENDLQVESHS
ncbi:MAG TPA: BON domain-containing protein [Terriglobia bacterium]|jgi:osmotically-inducible protein OsmY